MDAEDKSLKPLEEEIREIQARVRARYPDGASTPAPGVNLADLLPLLHARDAAEAKVAAIGTVNPRPPGFKNSLVQAWKRLIARVLDWHVREQVEFNRAQMNCIQAVLEALEQQNRAIEALAATIGNTSGSLKNRADELEAIISHWHEWRQEWERKLSLNEIQFLRSAAELQSGFAHRSSQMEASFRASLAAQHGAFEAALAKASSDLDRAYRAELESIRTEYESLIHSELRSVRQKAFAAAAAPSLAPAAPAPPQSYDFLRFADRFRGSEEYVRHCLLQYRPYFEGLQNIVDLGCGRGEWLAILAEAGIAAKGIDGDAESVALCRSRNLNVELADLFAWLDGVPPASLDAITAFQVIEHLPPLELPGFLARCATALAPGGLLLLETPNPECLAIFASHFYLDPTHQRPVPPQLAVFLMEEAGFGRMEVLRPAPAVESMPSLAELPEGFRNAFFGSLDYAVIGRKL